MQQLDAQVIILAFLVTPDAFSIRASLRCTHSFVVIVTVVVAVVVVVAADVVVAAAVVVVAVFGVSSVEADIKIIVINFEVFIIVVVIIIIFVDLFIVLIIGVINVFVKMSGVVTAECCLCVVGYCIIDVCCGCLLIAAVAAVAAVAVAVSTISSS